MPPDLKPAHLPVLLEEVLAHLAPETGRTYADATLGAGGHAEAILERCAPEGRLLGIDQDPLSLQLAGERLARFRERFKPVQGNFSTIGELLPPDFKPLSGGILADIGVSSMQLDTAERGFSFMKEAPLDMRMSPSNPVTAADLVNGWSAEELQRIFSEYGEEHMSRSIAQAIVARRRERPFETTTDLASLISELYKSRGKHEKIHPATRVFQALRIAVNDELGSLERFLNQLPNLLAPGARIVIISFHSLEDRIIKQFFQAESRDCLCPPRLPVCQCGHRATLKILTRKPVEASDNEIRQNPRSRSARLRAAIRL